MNSRAHKMVTKPHESGSLAADPSQDRDISPAIQDLIKIPGKGVDQRVFRQETDSGRVRRVANSSLAIVRNKVGLNEKDTSIVVGLDRQPKMALEVFVAARTTFDCRRRRRAQGKRPQRGDKGIPHRRLVEPR